MEEILELFTDPLWLPLFFRAVRDPLAHEPSPAFQRLMTFERTEDANIIQALLRAFGPCLPSWTWDIFMVCPADVEMRVPADVANLIVPMPALGSLAEADAIFAGIFLEDEDFERCEYTSAVAQSALATGCWITRSDGSLSLLNPVNESVTIGTLDFGLILTISHAFLSSSAPPPPPPPPTPWGVFLQMPLSVACLTGAYNPMLLPIHVFRCHADHQPCGRRLSARGLHVHHHGGSRRGRRRRLAQQPPGWRDREQQSRQHRARRGKQRRRLWGTGWHAGI